MPSGVGLGEVVKFCTQVLLPPPFLGVDTKIKLTL